MALVSALKDESVKVRDAVRTAVIEVGGHEMEELLASHGGSGLAMITLIQKARTLLKS